MLKNFLMDESGAELAVYAVAVALLVAIGLITLLSMSRTFAQSDDARKIDEWLKGYDAALMAKDLDKLAVGRLTLQILDADADEEVVNWVAFAAEACLPAS